MERAVRERIFSLADNKYQVFLSKIVPNANNIIGVRSPLLRKLAKEIAKGDWRKYLATAESDYFEEVMLQGLVLGYVKADVEEILGYIVEFIPMIQNWAVCDSFCNSLKFTQEHKERVWDFLQPYLASSAEYEIRFGVVMLLEYYIEENYVVRVLAHLDDINHPGYYVKMAAAWAISLCYIKFPRITMDYLQNSSLDDFTYNKALQKIIESYQVNQDTKKIIRSMKRK